jgi:hypothetical protein
VGRVRVSAPLELSSTELRQLATALDELTALTESTGVSFCAYGPVTVIHLPEESK